jgi:hypothetical protein
MAWLTLFALLAWSDSRRPARSGCFSTTPPFVVSFSPEGASLALVVVV